MAGFSFKIPKIPNVSVPGVKLPVSEINKASAQINKAGGITVGSTNISGSIKKTSNNLKDLNTAINTIKNVTPDIKSGKLSADSVKNDLMSTAQNGGDMEKVVNKYKDKYMKGE